MLRFAAPVLAIVMGLGALPFSLSLLPLLVRHVNSHAPFQDDVELVTDITYA